MYKVKDLIDEIEQVKEIYKDNTDMNPKEWLYDFRRNEDKSLYINWRI
jgi:hypothetical protein